MGWFSHEHRQSAADSHSQFYESENKAELSHELIAGAASYEAMKAYEEHVERNGKPVSHAKAKEILAGIAGAFIDRELETRGMDFAQREILKHKAKKQAEESLQHEGQW